MMDPSGLVAPGAHTITGKLIPLIVIFLVSWVVSKDRFSIDWNDAAEQAPATVLSWAARNVSATLYYVKWKSKEIHYRW